MHALYKAVLFDFDGTLVDSSEGIYQSLRYAFSAAGDAIPTDDVLRKFIGPPLYDSFQDLFHYDDEKIAFLIEKYREHYREKGYQQVQVYPGIRALLSQLHEQGIRLGTASSKPRYFVQKILEEQKLDGFFDHIGGTEFDYSKATKTEIIETALKSLHMKPQEALMVGDRLYDIDGAKGAHVPCAAVLYGFGSREEFIEHGAEFLVEQAADLEKLIFGA